VSSLSPDSLACTCNAASAIGWPVVTTVSLAQAKQLCHVDELPDDRKSSAPEATVDPSPAAAFLREQQRGR
jgi:hypothetical protein